MKVLNLNNGSEKNVIVTALHQFLSIEAIDSKENNLSPWDRQKLGEFGEIVQHINSIDYIGIEGVEGVELFLKILTTYKRELTANLNTKICEKHPLLKMYFTKRLNSTEILLQNLIK